MEAWRDAYLAAIDRAALDALSGRPRLVIVHGGPGSGRTSFLAAATARAIVVAAEAGSGFVELGAEGAVKSDSPLQGLVDLGVRLPEASINPVASAQLLREAIDDALDAGPLLMTIDDLQWLDAESVDALATVVSSAVAERLLIIASTGFFEPFQHQAWQDLVTHNPIAMTVELEGLDVDQSLEVMRDIRPEISEQLARRLWEHTAGNPLFLTSLVRRNDPQSLERMVQLPAPEEYARAIESRLANLGGEALSLARAASVVGLGWSSLAESAYVGEILDAAVALDTLVAEFILEKRSTELGSEIRIVHAVIQASIYQNIPTVDRVRLHLRASDVAADEASELRHAFAAATSFDEDLAARLEGAATRAHASHSHRTAAQYMDWASRLTANGLVRSQRWTISLYEHLLAGNVELVRNELPELSSARDRRGAAVVRGTLLVSENRWRDAVNALSNVQDTQDGDLTSYRINILLAWASMASGADAEESAQYLDRAESSSDRDDALAGLATFTAAMVDRRRGRSRFVQARLGALPDRPAMVPIDDTYWLAWRGFAAVMSGRAQEAFSPLREVQTRMATGLLNVGDGLTNAFLGLGYWFAGDVALAATQFRAAESLLQDVPNPMTASYAAIGHVITGDRDGALRLLTSARQTLLDAPWPEGISALVVGSVVVLHAIGTDEERASFMPDLRADFGAHADRAAGSAIWQLHAALACAWASDFDEANRIAQSLADSGLDWGEAALFLIKGIDSWVRGDLEMAAEHYRRSLSRWPETLSVIAAHTAYDLTRVLAAMGDDVGAARIAERVRDRYGEFQAEPYLAVARSLPGRDDESTSTSAPAAPAAPVPRIPPAFDALSERERDVAALVVKGMSYAQIARELFISRSTVGFHLTRIYAKTDTSSRHELSELVRAHL